MDALIECLKDRIQNKELTPATIPPPAPPREVEWIEQELGFPLPPLLRRIYLEVANGGFGLGSGILGISSNGATNENGNTAVSLYLKEKRQKFKGMLPICYYGCLAYGYLDCNEENGAVYLSDEGKLSPEPLALTLQNWLENWLNKENNSGNK